MKTEDKQQLVILLHKYMAELVEQNDANIKEAKRLGDNRWKGTYTEGVKTKYEHARILASKLALDVNKEMKTYWEL